MSKAVITLTDEDGSVDVHCEFDPPLNDGTGSPAQAFALEMIEAVAAPDELASAKFSR